MPASILIFFGEFFLKVGTIYVWPEKLNTNNLEFLRKSSVWREEEEEGRRAGCIYMFREDVRGEPV